MQTRTRLHSLGMEGNKANNKATQHVNGGIKAMKKVTHPGD